MPPRTITPAIAQNDLAAGERVLWSERPDPVVSMASASGVTLFALFWLLITVSGLVEAANNGETISMVFLSVFVAIGVFLLLTPIIEFRTALGTAYAITDRRLIIAQRHGRSTKSVQLVGINQVERVRRRNKVTLRIPVAIVSDGDGGHKVDYIDLHGLQDGERAYRLLTQPGRSINT